MIDPDPTDMASATSHDGDRAEFLQCVPDAIRKYTPHSAHQGYGCDQGGHQ
jgi:hypothetical protein